MCAHPHETENTATVDKTGGIDPYWWVVLSDDEILNLRLCDLNLSIAGSTLQGRIEIVLKELQTLDLNFNPHFWISDEWFCADGIPGVAIPFYLAHPRLERLERSQLLEVEGGDGEVACGGGEEEGTLGGLDEEG